MSPASGPADPAAIAKASLVAASLSSSRLKPSSTPPDRPD
jgi:hypothetical protein